MKFSLNRFGRRCMGGVVLGTILALGITNAVAADQVNARFSWKLKGEYAPFYHAQNSGGFKAQDLTVRLGEGAGSQAALGALIQGQEDVVIMPAIFAMSAIQRGMPVKLIALYHRRAPMALISHPDKPITTPKDLEGKKLATAVGETGTSYLGAFCKINSIDCDKITMIMMDRGARMPQFLQKQVDAVSVYLSNDLPLIQAKTGVIYPILDLGKFGLAVPGLAVVSSDTAIAGKPGVLKRFLKAVGASIAATKKDPAAGAASLRKSWDGAPNMAIVTAQVQATVDAMHETDGKATGWINSADLQATIDMLKSAGKFKDAKPVAAFFTNDLLAK